MSYTADKAVLELGEALANDPAFPDDWEKIVAVFKIQPGTVGGWVKYSIGDGPLKNTWLEDDETDTIVERLHALTQVEGKRPWVACRATIERDEMKLNIQFEYDDEKRWDTPLPF